MNQIASFKSRLTDISKKSILPTITEPSFSYGGGSFLIGGNITGTGTYITQSTVRQISTVTSCINIITEDVSKIPFHMEQMTETNGWVPVPLVSPIGNIVRYPNNRHTMKEIFRMCIDDLIMNGNAYIVIIRDDSGMPSEFIYVPYNSVSVYENEEGDLIYNANHKMFKNKTTSDSKENGFTRNIHFEDMIHLKKNVVNGEITGRGLIYTASEVFGLALAAQETAARTFNNGAALPGFIKTDEQVDEETATQIKSRFMEAQGGVNKSGSPAVISGATFIKTGMSPAELQLENARNQQTIEIARMLRIPLYKLAVPSSSETATLEEQEISYIHNTLNFYTNLIEEEFNRKIFLRRDMEKYRFHFDFTSIAIPDFQKRISAWAMAHTNGFVTSGYVAARENFPIPSDENGGNQYVVPVNQAVISGDDSVPLGLSTHDGDKTPVHDTPMKQAEEVQ